MKTNLQRRFEIVQDVREVECPFGPGIYFEIRRLGHPAVREWAEAAQNENPLVARYFAELTKEQTKRAILGKGGKVDPEAVAERVFADESIDIGSMAHFQKANLRRVAAFVQGWRGLTDENDAPVPFSEAALLDLLRSDERLGENEPYSTVELEIDGEKRTVRRNLGAALAAWIEETAKDGEAYREALAKNSEASSAGVSAGSQG